MTIRKRLSRTNTRILLFALLSLLVIGVFIIEIFEKTYLEQAINYVKLQDHSVELVDFLDEYQFSEDEIGTLRKKIRSYGHNFYIAKDRQRVSTDFSTKQLREMQYLDSYVTINEPADVFVWRTATMIFKSYETETGTYQVVDQSEQGDISVADTYLYGDRCSGDCDHCGDQQIFQPEVRKQDHGADRKADRCGKPC